MVEPTKRVVRYPVGDNRAVSPRSKPLVGEAYRGRNVIKRGYSELNQWCGLATQYDKLGPTYRAGAVLRAVIQWLNRLL